jgi:hypothetical protein
VKDCAGRVAGLIAKKHSETGTYGYVVDLLPRRVPAGWVLAEPWGGYATAYRGGLFTGDINYYGEGLSRFRTESGRGLAVKKARNWVILKRVKGSWRRVGTVPLSCPSQWVLGSGILLFGIR